jgi:predicted nucleic acid-binding protein
VIVVDANVIVALWLPTSGSDLSERLLARDPEWAAPLLWRSELRSVLAGYLRRGALDASRASAIAEDAEEHLRGREYQVPSSDVLRCVAESRCSAYDCEYVALAQQLGVALITNDREILSQFPRVASRPEAFLRA